MGDHRVESRSGRRRWSPLDRLDPLAQVATLGLIVRWLLHVDDIASLFARFGWRAVAHGQWCGPEGWLLRGTGATPRWFAPESLISATQNFLNLPGASGPTTSPIDVPEDHMALTPKTGTSSAVSLATAGSVPPSLTAKSWTGASLPAAGGPTADWNYPLSTLKAHRQDLADLTGRSGTPRKRPSDESSE